jgi:hypothetical protein
MTNARTVTVPEAAHILGKTPDAVRGFGPAWHADRNPGQRWPTASALARRSGGGCARRTTAP